MSVCVGGGGERERERKRERKGGGRRGDWRSREIYLTERENNYSVTAE